MATEADAQRYRYIPEESEVQAARVNATHSFDEKLNKLRKRTEGGQPKGKTAPSPIIKDAHRPAFFHNALHDLESILWIAIWFLVKKRVKPGLSSVEFDPTNQRHLANELFYGAGARLALMSVHNDFSSWIEDLHSEVQSAARILNQIRRALLRCYLEAEKDLSSIGKDVASSLYESMSTSLGEAAFELQSHSVLLEDFTRVPAEAMASAPAAAEAKESGSHHSATAESSSDARPTRKRKLSE